MNMLAVEMVIERAAPVKDVLEDVDGDAPRPEPGNFRGLYPSRTSHQASVRRTILANHAVSFPPVMPAFIPAVQAILPERRRGERKTGICPTACPLVFATGECSRCLSSR